MKPITHKPMTLGDLILALRELPVTSRTQLSDNIFSYRGFYERNAVEATDYVLNSHDLADRYEKQLGGEMHGWKGGDFEISRDELVYVVDSQRNTGPVLIGLMPDPVDGRYLPVLLDGQEMFW